jgi:hypothetical protein
VSQLQLFGEEVGHYESRIHSDPYPPEAISWLFERARASKPVGERLSFNMARGGVGPSLCHISVSNIATRSNIAVTVSKQKTDGKEANLCIPLRPESKRKNKLPRAYRTEIQWQTFRKYPGQYQGDHVETPSRDAKGRLQSDQGHP